MIETDGPPGAIAIGNALEQLGNQVVYVTDSYGTAVMEATKSEAATVIDFPIADDAESEAFAQQLSPTITHQSSSPLSAAASPTTSSTATCADATSPSTPPAPTTSSGTTNAQSASATAATKSVWATSPTKLRQLTHSSRNPA